LGVLGLLLVLAFAGGTAVAHAETSWSFESPVYDFGPRLPNSGPSEPQNLTLTNTGDTYLGISGWGDGWHGVWPLDPELFDFENQGCEQGLEPGESCKFVVTFNPTYVGPKYGDIAVETNAPGVPDAEIELLGEGAGPWGPVGPRALSFGEREAGTGPTPAQIATVENKGSLPMTIKKFTFTDYDETPLKSSPFQVVGGSCEEGGQVPPRSSCTVEIALESLETGSWQSKLVVDDDAPEQPESPKAVELWGSVYPARPTGPVEWTPPIIVQGPPDETELAEMARRAEQERRKQTEAEKESERRSVGNRIRLTGHPRKRTASRTATFRFGSQPDGLSIECRLDHLEFTSCESPMRYADLTVGRHRFQMRDAWGEPGQRWVRKKFIWRVLGRK
jgi:hypothetical protein